MSQDINLVANGKVPQFLDESALFWWCFVVVSEGWSEMLQGKVFFWGGTLSPCISGIITQLPLCFFRG